MEIWAIYVKIMFKSNFRKNLAVWRCYLLNRYKTDEEENVMKLLTVKELYKDSAKFIGQTVEIGGWIRNIRDSKTFGFLVINRWNLFSDPSGGIYR